MISNNFIFHFIGTLKLRKYLTHRGMMITVGVSSAFPHLDETQDDFSGVLRAKKEVYYHE